MITWKEKIVDVMTEPDGKKLWFSTKIILKRIYEKYPSTKKTDSLSCYMIDLIRKGYAERTLNPESPVAKKEYLYRLTGKKYQAVNVGELISKTNSRFIGNEKYKNVKNNLNIGRELYWRYPNIEKEIRNMMK